MCHALLVVSNGTSVILNPHYCSFGVYLELPFIEMMVSNGFLDKLPCSTTTITSLGSDKNAKDGEIWKTVVVETVFTNSTGNRVAPSMSFDISSKLEGWLKDAGFVNVERRVVTIPVGGTTALGRLNQVRLHTGVFDFSARRLANVLGVCCYLIYATVFQN